MKAILEYDLENPKDKLRYEIAQRSLELFYIIKDLKDEFERKQTDRDPTYVDTEARQYFSNLSYNLDAKSIDLDKILWIMGASYDT